MSDAMTPGAPEPAALAPYAVIFKTHFWNGFVGRQYDRLCQRAGPGRVFIMVDVTEGPVADLPDADIIPISAETSIAEGYLPYPNHKLFWYNTDYQLFHFVDHHPEFEYVVTAEYDCTVNYDIADLIRAMQAQSLDFVGEPTNLSPESWPWTKIAQPYYPDMEITGRLVCFAAFSRKLSLDLKQARLDQTRRAREGQIRTVDGGQVVYPEDEHFVWPNNESFVGTEIRRLGAAEAPLSAFGSTAYYDWAPAALEGELPRLASHAFVHPVLDPPRYIASALRLKWDLHDAYRPGTYLHQRMEHCDPAAVVDLFLPYFLQQRETDAVTGLRLYAEARAGGAARAMFNVARNKPATQSSVSQWSKTYSPTEDAGGAVNGAVTGGFGFHTNQEQSPWWCVDLQLVCPVREIVIYNRLELSSRADWIVVAGSKDMLGWEWLYTHDGTPYGGADGAPLRITLAQPAEARFVRLQLQGAGVLHLDEVEIYV